MGKDKSQRTKGNVQPSSSGRAAKLVTRDGNVSFPGFDGLGAGGTIQLGYIPLAAGGTEDNDSPIDPQFRVVMRKLTKRDSVTKLKAVQEFTEMCKSSSLDAVEGVLPFWPRIYNRLAMDPDHRVREATQAAMEQLVLRVHRNLAPHLKSVIGVWLCAQYDNYAPVATAAVHSFHAAFNEEKRAEVVMFCRKELVEFLQQNLLTHTADSLSDPKLVSEEERLAKYHRTISSSLHTLGHLISVLTPELNLTLQEKYRSLFESKKLWKFAKHKSSHIRGALFALVATCCQKFPHIMISLETQVSSVVLGSLDDSDPAVCRHLWDAVLSVLQCTKECWSHVNIRKAVLPKLWMLLRSGGSGSASVIYPSLLPLISHIPDEITCSSVEFYKEFFNNLRDGLHQEKVQKSRKESEAVISAFMECLRFSLFYQGNSSYEEKTLKERQKLLVNEQLLPLLRFSLEGKSKSWSFSFYALLANILSSFTKSPTEPETDMTRRDERENKKEIFNVFWQGCTSLCLECVLSQNSATLDLLAQFLICLKEPAQKRAQKVFFLEDELTEMNSNELKNDSNELKNMQNGEKPLSLSVTKSSKPYNGYLLNLVCNVCTVCLAEALEHGSLLHLQLLSKLTQPFLCDQLVKELLVKQNSLSPSKEQCCVGSESFEELCICTVDSILLPMLNSSGSRAWDNGECILYVTDIVYDVIGQMSLENQLQSLNKFLEVNNRIILFCALVEKGCQKNPALMLTWLKESLAKERVCLITQSLLVPDSTHLGSSTIIHSDAEREAAWKIVELCLLPKRELLLDDETTNTVLQLLLDFLYQFKGDHTREDDICRLLPRLQSFIKLFETKTKDVPSCLVNILYAAFELRLSQSISSEVSEALIKTWDVGLSLASCRSEECNPDSLEFGLISRAVNMVVTHLLTHDDIKGIEALSKVALQLTQRISENKVENQLHSVVMKTIFPAEEKFSMWRDSSSKVLWEVQPILEQRLPKVTSINKGLGDFQTLMVPTEHVKMALFVAYNIRNLINVDSKVDDLVRLALEILWLQRWCLCCADSELNHASTNQTACKQVFESSNPYSLVHQCYLELDQSINIILEHLREQRFMDQLIEEALNRSKLHGNIWALVFSRVLRSLQAINTTIDSQLLLGNVLGVASEDEFTCQTLVSVVENLQSIYDLKLLHEQYSRLLGQGKDNAAVSMSLLVETACLRQWSLLTSGSEAALTEYQLTLVEVLDQIIDCKNSRQDLLLFTCSTSDLPMALVSFNCSLSQLMGLAVTFSAVNLKSCHWDFILCSLASWLQMCDENSRTLTDSVSGLLLCHAACSLHALVVSFFSTTAGKLAVAATDAPVDSVLNEADQTGRSDSTLVNVGASAPGLPPNLVAEWEEFFCGTICRAALNLFLDYSARLTTADTTTVTSPMVRLAECLGRAVVLTPLSDLINYQRESGLLDIDKDNIAWSQQTLCRFLPYLECHIHSLQLASYNILIRLMPKITYEEPRKVNSSELQEEDTRSPPGPLMNLAEKAAIHMMAILSDAGVPFGECLCMATDVEARDTCLTLMLAWKLILAFFRNTSQESRAEYAAFLRQTKAVENLLGIIFRLIPLAKERPIVKEDVAVNIGDIVDGESLHEICCSVFYDLLQWMPAMVRQWWNGLDKRRSAIVDKFTASVITPVLCQHEMQLVQSSTRRFDNMTVRARPSAREVAAIYTVDEISMELVVKLASNHPLGVVTVESGRKVGVTSGQWRSWMLQMTTFLTHQNGSIMDGLILWKHNVDKRFEGVDDCMICFSVIHASNYSLPKLTCKTCKKKFHSICLYRWFNTSNNSTCPLCRNLF